MPQEALVSVARDEGATTGRGDTRQGDRDRQAVQARVWLLTPTAAFPVIAVQGR